jgi:hypothetical protein
MAAFLTFFMGFLHFAQNTGAPPSLPASHCLIQIKATGSLAQALVTFVLRQCLAKRPFTWFNHDTSRTCLRCADPHLQRGPELKMKRRCWRSPRNEGLVTCDQIRGEASRRRLRRLRYETRPRAEADIAGQAAEARKRANRSLSRTWSVVAGAVRGAVSAPSGALSPLQARRFRRRAPRSCFFAPQCCGSC